MTNYNYLHQIISEFNNNNFDFIILRKSECLIEKKINDNDDIDILLNLRNRSNLKNFLKKKKFIHYQDSAMKFIYLYSSIPHDHYFDKKNKIHFDIAYDISYKSPNQGEIIPIDDNHALDYWSQKIRIDLDKNCYIHCLNKEHLLEHILCHCIFDKKKINNYYHSQIISLYKQVNKKILTNNLERIFFKFSKRLIELLDKEELENIYEKYITFREY